MSEVVYRLDTQHAHGHTVLVHWPSAGSGTFSSDEQIHLAAVSFAAHWVMAVNSAVQVLPTDGMISL